MKETTKGYLRKLVANTEDILSPLSRERNTEQEMPVPNSLPSPSGPPRPQQKVDHSAGLPKEKSKKRRIPFIALALVVLFSSLCILSLFSQQPFARAAIHSSATTHHRSAVTSLQDAATPSASCLVTDCYGVAATPNTWGVYKYSLSSDCSNHYQTAVGDFCWNDNDFQWGARDITCVQNTHLTDQQTQLNKERGINFGPTTTSSTGVQSTPVASSVLPNVAAPAASSSSADNQQTCTSDSTCFSDDRTQQDGTQIHAKIGGDDIICFNNACISKGTPPASANCGGLPYDRFACNPIMNGSQQTGYFYNPTSYYPSGSFEMADANLSLNGQNGSIQTGASNDMPTCDNRWICPGGDQIYLALTNNSGTFANPFTGNPEEIAGSTTTDYQSPSGPGNNPGVGGPGGNAASDTTTTWNYPPMYEVGCYANGSNWVFPCSDKPDGGGVNEPVLQNDWFSGDIGTMGSEKYPDHLAVTYADETHAQANLVGLSTLTLALGYALVGPALVLIGYQLLWASWTFGRVATMEMLARVLLSIMAVGISYQLTTMLVGLSNLVSHAVVTLHGSIGYPDIKLNGTNLTYTLEGEQGDTSSFRGIVLPLSRWGCSMNDFMGILEDKLLTDGLAFLPFVGGFVKLAKGITDAEKAFRDIGEFVVLLFSINLAIQVFVRVALINYYILTAPVAFGCWGLPGGVGQKVVSQWFKGFCSILFVQAAQLFVLTTMPLLLPTIPQLPTDTLGLFYTLLIQLPRIIVLMAVIKVPAIMGSGAAKAIAKAGTVGSGAVAAVGAAAYGIV